MLNRLANFRERRGLTQGDLAQALEVSRQTIVSIEKGKYDPSLPLAKEIARYFRVAVEDVFPAAEAEVATTTATFLMTDIEGSTALAAALGADYIRLLGRLRELLIDVFTQHIGRVVDDIGDACFAVFEEPERAIQAALAAQRAVASETWPGEASVKIRIGVHTGQAFEVGNRFVGLAVHEAARVCSTAEGGQILACEATATSGAASERLTESGQHDLHGVGRRRLFVVR